MSKVVVIGGDAAGMSAAAQISRHSPDADLVAFEKGDYTSFAACGLPYLVGGQVPTSADLVARSPEKHRANGIDVRTRHEVLSIDVDGRTVEVRSSDEDRTFTEGFDHLVIATGAVPIRPPFPNVDAKGVHVLHTIPHAEAIDAMIRERSPRHAVVVGAGYIGIEVVEALVNRGLQVTVVERLDAPLATLDADMGGRVAEAIASMGVDLRLGTSVEGIEVDADGWARAVATDEGEVPAELVVMGLGVRPNVGLAADAGIEIGTTGAIAADARMQTSVEGIWTAGDCAQSLHRVSNQPTWIALGTHANKQGRVAGLNVAGTHARFPGVIGTAVTKVGETEIGMTGLNERAAVAAGFDPVSAVIEADTRAHYYPDAEKIAVKIVAERGSGRMLGAQIVGGAESAKRIDALAVGVWNEMTVDEFSQLDLGYAPPFAPVWDSTLVAARIAGGKVHR